METAANSGAAAPEKKQSEAVVIVASSVGSVFEWYDFFLYGTLLPFINKHFYTGVDETTGYILALATFSAGFVVRPFGALVFGWVGDMVGRKATFLVAMVIMGASTFLVGFLPNAAWFQQNMGAGIIAPIILVFLRVLQGLAVGGQYGGAVTYVAEHAPPGKRGLFTSWIQITATARLAIALAIVAGEIHRDLAYIRRAHIADVDAVDPTQGADRHLLDIVDVHGDVGDVAGEFVPLDVEGSTKTLGSPCPSSRFKARYLNKSQYNRPIC